MSVDIKFTTEREGDFFSAVLSHTIALQQDGADIPRIQGVVRAAHTDISADSIINLLLSSFGEISALTEHALQRVAAGEELRILFSTRTVATYKVNFTASLSDANLNSVPFEFAFTLPQARLYEDFRSACSQALGLENGPALSTVVSIEGGGSLFVNGDKTLEEFLTEIVRSDTESKPHVVATVTAKGAKQRVRVEANLSGELECRGTEFEFEFAPTDLNLLESLRATIRHELELDGEKKQLALFAVVDEATFPLTEKVLVEVLTQNQATKLVVECQLVMVTATRQVKVFCRFADQVSGEEAEIVFRYNLVEGSLLQALCCEIAGEMESEFDRARLTYVSGEDTVIVGSDRMLREILLENQSELHLLLRPIEAKSSLERAKPVKCSFDGEEASFNFIYNLSNDGLLELFKAECRSEMDMMPNDRITVTALVEDARIPIERDGTLLELLSNDGELFVFVQEVRPPPKVVVFQKEVTCSLGSDTVAFQFAFTLEQDGLLEYLSGEVKDELDLLPSEEIILSLVVEGEAGEEASTMDVITDRMLRDVMLEVPTLVFNVKLKKKAQKEQVRVAAFHWKTPSEDAECQISFRDSDALLQLLVQEIRSELELDGTVGVGFTDAMGGALDEAGLRALANQGKTAAINVILPKSQRDALEEMPLNRNAELHALYYEWQDILAEQFDASDMRLVLQNVKQDGKALPPSDAIFGKVAEFANSCRSCRTETDLLPFIGSMMSHYADADVSTLCHLCRDVISFMVDVSPQSRYRRAVSQVFRTLSVNDTVSLQQLVALLTKSGVDATTIDDIVVGFGEKLSLRDFRSITEQVFGETVHGVVDLITIAEEASPTTSRRGEREVHVLRRQRLLSELKHSIDFIAPPDLNQLDVDALKYCLAALITPQTIMPQKHDDRAKAAAAWFAGKVQTEVACYNFYAELAGFRSSNMDETMLHDVCALLVSNDLTPSFLLPTSRVGSAISQWATAAVQLVCQNRRLMFPHVLSAGQSPLVARKPDAPKGASAPRQLRKLYEERSPKSTALVSAHGNSPGSGERFIPRLRHLTNDLQITDGQNPPMSYRELTKRQTAENNPPAAPQ